MKALAEEVKMVYLVAATVVQVVVEMVEKFGGEMGSMVFHGGKEEGGGMEVLLLLLEMEEEMEKGMLVGFVVKMEVEKWSMGGQGSKRAAICSLVVVAGNKKEGGEKEERNERKRRSGVIYIVGKVMIASLTLEAKE